MKAGRSLDALVAEVQRQQATKRDYIVPTQAMRVFTEREAADRTTIVSFDKEKEPLHFLTNDHAQGQLAGYLNIPKGYFDMIHSGFPVLFDNTLNTLLTARLPEDKRMVRTLDGKARAFVSTNFNALDNIDMIEYIVPALAEIDGMEAVSCEITDLRMYLRVSTPRIAAKVRGDIIQAGLELRNSEVGVGFWELTPWLLNQTCMNGSTYKSYGKKRSHRGAAWESGGDVIEVEYADDTRAARNRAFYLECRDLVTQLMTTATLMELIAPIQEATEVRLKNDPVKVVEIVAKKSKLTEDEQGAVLQHYLEGGDLSLWGLSQAITRTATDVPSFDRSSDLEQLGGYIITLPKSEYRELIAA